MTLRQRPDGGLDLVGNCSSEEAENLLARLIASPGAVINWRECDWAHTAVIQVLLAAQVTPVGPPRNPFLADKVEPLLNQR